MEKDKRINFVGAALLSGALSLTQAGLTSAENYPKEVNNLESVPAETTPENEKYDLFLDAMDEMIKLERCSGLNQMFDDLEADPEKHIEVIDSRFLVYHLDEKTQERKPNWSIQFSYNETHERGTMAIVIDKKWDYFKGDDDMLATLSGVPTGTLMTISNHAFNIPEQMKELRWTTLGEDNDLFYLDKKYVDREGNLYIQRVREDNVILYDAPFPIPNNNPFEYLKPSMKNKDEDRFC